jgi:acyl-CoA synthetase (AMP-forming)/AMP-acid ligase II
LWYNKKSSSEAKSEESVEEIRKNAPEWFKTGNRLVTTADYEYYIRNRFRDNIVDVKCQNNWQYISTFY